MRTYLKIFAIAAVLAMAAGVCSASQVLDPKATYGAPAGGGATDSATWYALGSGAFAGITAGTSISLNAVGSICFAPCGSETAVSSIGSPIVAGFAASSGSTTFLATGLGAFSTIGGWSNDFANDFVVTSTGTGFFTVPTGANFIVAVFYDTLYSDNSDASNTFGINAGISGVVPEPATYAMMLGGLGLLAGWRRFRRS